MTRATPKSKKQNKKQKQTKNTKTIIIAGTYNLVKTKQLRVRVNLFVK